MDFCSTGKSEWKAAYSGRVAHLAIGRKKYLAGRGRNVIKHTTGVEQAMKSWEGEIFLQLPSHYSSGSLPIALRLLGAHAFFAL